MWVFPVVQWQRICQPVQETQEIQLGNTPWSTKWHPLPHSCLENSMDRGTWRATLHGAAKESDTTKHARARTHTHTHVNFGRDTIQPIMVFEVRSVTIKGVKTGPDSHEETAGDSCCRVGWSARPSGSWLPTSSRRWTASLWACLRPDHTGEPELPAPAPRAPEPAPQGKAAGVLSRAPVRLRLTRLGGGRTWKQKPWPACHESRTWGPGVGRGGCPLACHSSAPGCRICSMGVGCSPCPTATLRWLSVRGTLGPTSGCHLQLPRRIRNRSIMMTTASGVLSLPSLSTSILLFSQVRGRVFDTTRIIP